MIDIQLVVWETL